MNAYDHPTDRCPICLAECPECGSSVTYSYILQRHTCQNFGGCELASG